MNYRYDTGISFPYLQFVAKYYHVDKQANLGNRMLRLNSLFYENNRPTLINALYRELDSNYRWA